MKIFYALKKNKDQMPLVKIIISSQPSPRITQVKAIPITAIVMATDVDELNAVLNEGGSGIYEPRGKKWVKEQGHPKGTPNQRNEASSMSDPFLTHEDLAPLLKRLDTQAAEMQAQDREIGDLRARVAALEEVISAETTITDNGPKRRPAV